VRFLLCYYLRLARAREFYEVICKGLKSGNILLWCKRLKVWWEKLMSLQKGAGITIPIRSTMPNSAHLPKYNIVLPNFKIAIAIE
jgi:hypothetical protein